MGITKTLILVLIGSACLATFGFMGGVLIKNNSELPFLSSLSFMDKKVMGSGESGHIYYVSPDGDDSNDGLSPDTAFRTIAHGVSVLYPGDTLIILPGTYQGETVTIPRSGTADKPITIKASSPGEAIMKNDGSGRAISTWEKSHLIIEGIKFYYYSEGLHLRRSSHIIVRKCIFLSNTGTGVSLSNGNPTDCEYSHDHLYTQNQFLDPYNMQDYGLCMYFSSNVEVLNNYFYGRHHQACSFKEIMVNCRAAYNVFDGFLYSAMYIGQNDDIAVGYPARSRNIIAEYNLFRRTSSYGAKRAVCIANVSDAIFRYNFIDSMDPTYGGHCAVQIAANSTGSKVYGNVIIDVRDEWAIEAATSDTEIFNNTIAGCDVGIAIVNGANPIIRNNIFYNNAQQVKILPTPNYTGYEEHSSYFNPDAEHLWVWQPDFEHQPVLEHNNWYPDYSGKGETDISVDPKFVGPIEPLEPGGYNPTFEPDFSRMYAYRLSPDSPCIDAGMYVGLPYNGLAPDIGALESDPVPRILGKYIFYNNCALDGNNPAANADDDNAIADNKSALLPGQTATGENYTNYSKGINGIMLDIVDFPDTPTIDDFVFKVGNDNNPANWETAPAPISITVREGAGVNQTDRVTILWPDGAIRNKWLEVIVKATERTGLENDVVFYFGNLPGDLNGDFTVDVSDLGILSSYYSQNISPPDLSKGDFNADGKIDVSDLGVLSGSYNHSLTILNAPQ